MRYRKKRVLTDASCVRTYVHTFSETSKQHLRTYSHTQVYPVPSWLENGIYSLQVAYDIVGSVDEEACGDTVPGTWTPWKRGTR